MKETTKTVVIARNYLVKCLKNLEDSNISKKEHTRIIKEKVEKLKRAVKNFSDSPIFLG